MERTTHALPGLSWIVSPRCGALPDTTAVLQKDAFAFRRTWSSSIAGLRVGPAGARPKTALPG